MINNLSTTVQAKHPYLNAVTHVGIRVASEEVIMFWGFFVYRSGIPIWHIAQIEKRSYKEYPRLLKLHDGKGWNVVELTRLVVGSVSNFGELPPTTTETTQDS